jgi:serine/threonine protein kinase
MRQLDNVLLSGLDPQLVKLCDFGYSKDGDLESACKTTCGTPEYMAPEVWAAVETLDPHELKCDPWGFTDRESRTLTL